MKCALNIEKFFNLLISIKALCIYIYRLYLNLIMFLNKNTDLNKISYI